MKRLKGFGISLILVFFIINSVSALRINEVELNPEGTDSGNEWIELYSESEINTDGWVLVNHDNKTMFLNGSFQNYLIIKFTGQWLDNSNEKIILKDLEGNIESETKEISDSSNNDKTWQYCSGVWKFMESTQNTLNTCQEQSEQNQNTKDSSDESLISLELKWKKENIILGEEFSIDVRAEELKGKDYDLKIFITPRNSEAIVSEAYDEKEDEWISGAYYLKKVFSGPGDKTETLKVRIKNGEELSEGNVNAKLRVFGTSLIAAETKKSIDFIINNEPKNNAEENTTITQENLTQNEEIIYLGNKGGQTSEKGEIVYESLNGKIKKYAIYALNFILIIIVLILIKFKNRASF